MRLSVKVQPRSSNSRVEKKADGSLKVYLQTAPVDGKANKALIEVLAEYLKVRKKDISIVTGETSRKKIIEIAGRQASPGLIKS